MAQRLVAGPGLIGREHQLASIASCLRAAEGEQGHVVLISGEAGIGKTRLMREAASRAQADGWLVLLGQATDLEGAPPYLPFVDALRSAVSGLDPAELARLAGNSGAELARILPEVGERLPDSSAPRPVIPMSERFRFFEAVSAFIAAIAQTQPRGLLLCLDDLHHADEATLLLLAHLGRRLANERAVVFAAYRDTEVDAAHAISRAVESLVQQGAPCIELKALELSATRRLLAHLAGSPSPPPAVARTFHEETDGNPFYIEELFAALKSEGRLFDASGRWRGDLRLGEAEVPRSLRLIIGRRLKRLSPECRQVLAAAAVLGRYFDHSVLAEVCDLNPEAVLAALDKAADQGLMEEDGGSLRFHHELFRQTLLSELTLARRQQLHLRAAQAMERAADGRAEGRLLELAHHFRLAGPVAENGKVTEYATRAGDQAAASLAFEEALRLYDVALSRLGARNHGERAELHMKRAEALFSLGRWREARPDLEAALQHVRPEERAEILTKLALASTWTPDMPAARRYTDEAADIVGALGLHHLDPAVEALRGHMVIEDADLTAGIRHFERSTSLAQGHDSGVYRRALWLYPLVLYQTGRHAEAVACVESSITIARQAGDIAELANMLPTLGLALAATGRYRDADRVLAEGRRIANDFQAPGLVAISKSAGFHMDTFDLAGAKRYAEEAHDPASSLEHWPFPTVSSGLDLIYIAARSGEVGEADTRLKEVARQVEGAMGRHGWLWRMRLAQAKAEVALVKGDWRQAEQFAADALRQSGAIPRPKYQALALETRGKALIGLGSKRDGLADLRKAVEIARPIGDPAMFLRAASDLLAFDGDDELVAEACGAAECIAANLPEEMLPRFLATEPVRLVYKLKASPFKRPRLPAGLSQRELEVLQLIAAGQSNQQIAERLVLSVRTVERHINHIYAKAGVSSRTQASARSGLSNERIAGLSRREIEVLRLLASGRSNAQIAEELVISLSTVAKHVTSILGKTGAANRTEAAAYAHRHGLA